MGNTTPGAGVPVSSCLLSRFTRAPSVSCDGAMGGQRHNHYRLTKGMGWNRGADGVPDMNALKTAMSTPGAAEAMAHDGVLAETLVLLVEA